MADVAPFAGIRYRLDRPQDAAALICPPYDVIDPPQAEALRERHPHNAVRLELPEEAGGADRYAHTAALYRSWLDEGVLRRDSRAHLYLYGQRYRIEGREHERLGVLAALRLQAYEEGIVLPHEQTFPKHREDRFRLLAAARAQFSPIFGLYSAPGAGVRALLAARTEREPDAVASDAEGVEHRLWVVREPGFAEEFGRILAERQVFIADGHHRYETALRYRMQRRREDPSARRPWYDRVLTLLVEMDDPGLVLLPTHRLIRQGIPEPERLRPEVEEYFEISEPGEAPLQHGEIDLLLPGRVAWRLRLRDRSVLDSHAAARTPPHSAAWRDLDVVTLHEVLLGRVLGVDHEAGITYTRSEREARAWAASGKHRAACLLPAPTVEELKAVAGAGDRMPQKSTYFWPKACAGLVIYGE